MLEKHVLDDTPKNNLRKAVHSLLESTLLIGHASLCFYCFYQLFLIGFISADAVEEFIFMLLSGLSISYIYSWHRFSIKHDNSNTGKATVPVYLNPLRFLSFSVSGFLGFIGFIFVNFETYRLDIPLQTAQLLALFFAILGVIQFIYTLLTGTTVPKVQRKS